jgi:hypothetical protein
MMKCVQVNEIVNQQTSISKDLDVILEAYLSVDPRCKNFDFRKKDCMDCVARFVSCFSIFNFAKSNIFPLLFRPASDVCGYVGMIMHHYGHPGSSCLPFAS